MEHTTENQTENRIATEQTVENLQESRSQYQKRKRDVEKQTKRKKRRKALLVTFVLVVLSGILCGTVIAGNINTPGDTIEIASANAQYMVSTLKNTVKDKLSDFSILLHNLPSPDDVVDTKPGDEVVKDDPDLDSNPENELETDTKPQTTTESAVSLITPDNPYGIDPSKPMVALTFDDGPSKYTWPIVSALAQYDARATFFLVGNRVATHEAAIDFILENHNEVASHSFSHANLAKITEEEVLSQIQKVDTALQAQHSYTPALFRVPYGERDEHVLQIMREQNKPVIGWSVDPRDWEVQDKDAVVKHVLSHVKDGDIILMHDLYKPTADAVAELIPALQERGYQLVTVSELFRYKGIELTPGTYYYASWKWV